MAARRPVTPVAAVIQPEVIPEVAVTLAAVIPAVVVIPVDLIRDLKFWGEFLL
jgi:hypothetical protein